MPAPDADVQWEHHPAHFWLVLAAALTSAALAFSTSAVALRRSDARLYLVSLAFLSAAGFLGLHALATPGVLLDTPNEGFALATPIGLLLSSLFAAASALPLLAEACVSVAFGRNWHASWWEWHLLMLLAFGAIAVVAHREEAEERFSDLYLDHTAAGTREVSVLFADLAGFTSFSEGRDPRQVSELLNAYLEVAIPPIVREHGGEIDSLIGDAIMATWGTRGDQPDHAESGRSYTVIGDTVNVAARLESRAPTGGVVVGGATLKAVPGLRATSLGEIEVKGKLERVDAYLLELRA